MLSAVAYWKIGLTTVFLYISQWRPRQDRDVSERDDADHPLPTWKVVFTVL